MKIKTPLITFLIVVLSYYLCVLPHEWSHGLMAWLFGFKTSPFHAHYGGFLLLHCDENVPYDSILAQGLGWQAALIGIAGITYNALMLCWSFYMLGDNRINKKPMMQRFFYWFAIFNMCPIIGYIPNGTFTTEGDIGRFVTGLHISPWYVFVPGTLIVACLVINLLKRKLYDLFALLNITSKLLQRCYLWFSIFVLFFLIYTHGYNPFSDPGASLMSKWIAAFSIVFAFFLGCYCDPSRRFNK
jgi:hypothetical protein